MEVTYGKYHMGSIFYGAYHMDHMDLSDVLKHLKKLDSTKCFEKIFFNEIPSKSYGQVKNKENYNL